MPQRCCDVQMDSKGDYSDVLKESKKVIRQCLEEYQLEEVFLSFNGGKDCTVLLDMVLDVLQDITRRYDVGQALKVFCIQTGSSFTELEDFMKQVETHYNIKLQVMQGEMKSTLEAILENDKALKACFMGTRRTDPYSENLEFMQETDGNWPKLLRVSPLLNWSYHQIWSYIHRKQVPYCSLYDIGYTSIGSTNNTSPNPHLKFQKPDGSTSYLPAWMLTDGSLERAGRGTKPTSNHSNGTDSQTLHKDSEKNGQL